jgi:hypothetical protein
MQAAHKAPASIGPPILNFPGGGYTSVFPADAVGDVGPNHYIQAINGSIHTQIRIYDKSGQLLAPMFALASLGAPPCNNGLGDPAVVYDQFADRWVLAEKNIGSPGALCVYVSKTPDPVAGGWYGYWFPTGALDGFAQFGVWPDAYYVGYWQQDGPKIYALERTKMLVGAPAAAQLFSPAPLPGFVLPRLQPADADGILPPPPGSPGLFWQHYDSESHGNPGAPDTLQYYEFHVDFAGPGNSTLTGPIDIPISEFDSDTCNMASSCVPQPDPSVLLRVVRDPVMHRVQYRNRGSYEVVVGSFVTDVGVDQHEVRWFEARKTAGPWQLHQEGTFGPDSTHRWVSSIAMDGSGNIALAYNVSSSTVFPGLRYTGRTVADPAGVMGGEQTIVDGGGSQILLGYDAYGDYNSLNVDPVDECTFWFTGEYNPTAQWATRVATFAFPVPECIPVPVGLESFVVE